MNVILASGGYPSTIVPVGKRTTYMSAPGAVSSWQNIVPFTRLIADLIEQNLKLTYRTVIFPRGAMMNVGDETYTPVKTTKELGQRIRTYRKSKHLTLFTVSGLGNFSERFLSELERGKETAEIGKVLKALHTLGLEIIIQPRGQAMKARRSGSGCKESP